MVHLHGYVGSVDERTDPQLVFNWQEYLRTISEAGRGSWQTRFRGEYQTAPFIILGARLSDELDVLEVVRAGNFSAKYGLPSLVVRPDITPFEKQEYERWGLTPVSTSAEDFFRYVVKALAARAPDPGATEYSTRYTDRVFVPLGRAYGTIGHDFYGGHTPEWSDIQAGLDAVPPWLEELVDDLSPPGSYGDVQMLFLIRGDPFTGKSTSLLRLASRLHDMGWSPILLAGRERIDWGETLQYFRSRPSAVLIVDGVVTDANDIAELLRRAKGLGQRLLVFGAERERHTEHIRRVIPAKMVIGLESTLFVEPTNAFWGQIVQRRRVAARLGRLEGVDDRTTQLHFVAHGRELFSALASLEDASGFIDRGLSVYKELPGRNQTAFAVIALLARFGQPAPISAICMAAGLQIQALIGDIQPGGSLAQWVVQDPLESGYVRLRHRYLGDLIVSPHALPHHTVPLRDVASSVCIALADQISPMTIRQKTIPHRIVASLMDLENVQALCGTEDVDDWYVSVESAYGWSARFWEQRALGLSHMLVLDRAYSYAQRAVSLHPDAFTLNTLGTVLMRRAAEVTTALSPNQRKGYWREAVDALAQSRERGEGRFEHPFITFFTYTLRLVGVNSEMDAEFFLLAEQAFRDWRGEAGRLDFFDSPQMRRLVSEYPPEWRT